MILVNNLIKLNFGGKTEVVHHPDTEKGRPAGLWDRFGIRLTEDQAECIRGWDMALSMQSQAAPDAVFYTRKHKKGREKRHRCAHMSARAPGPAWEAGSLNFQSPLGQTCPIPLAPHNGALGVPSVTIPPGPIGTTADATKFPDLEKFTRRVSYPSIPSTRSIAPRPARAWQKPPTVFANSGPIPREPQSTSTAAHR